MPMISILIFDDLISNIYMYNEMKYILQIGSSTVSV